MGNLRGWRALGGECFGRCSDSVIPAVREWGSGGEAQGIKKGPERLAPSPVVGEGPDLTRGSVRLWADLADFAFGAVGRGGD
jgi:hypothetical protein